MTPIIINPYRGGPPAEEWLEEDVEAALPQFIENCNLVFGSRIQDRIDILVATAQALVNGERVKVVITKGKRR